MGVAGTIFARGGTVGAADWRESVNASARCSMRGIVAEPI
jgi:hypothetical protein